MSMEDFKSHLSPASKQRRGISTHIDLKTLLLPGSADIIHSPNVRAALRMKLLQFVEDVRPAYYGTFTKRSHIVKSHQPLAQDTDILDYNVDSEAEWEPEGEGEDINSDEDEDDTNAEVIDPEDVMFINHEAIHLTNTLLIQVGWLVPEGYLSDNEGVEDEDEGDRPSNKPAFNQQKNGSKRGTFRKIVLGPLFEGETEDDEVMKPFATHLFVEVTKEGYNPFYKEPSKPSSNITFASSTKTEFTAEHKNALINVSNEKNGLMAG